MRNSVCWTIAMAVLFAVGCSDKTAPAGGMTDSLLMKPQTYKTDTVRPGYNANGLIVDSLRTRTPEHDKLMARFEPKQVLQIYEDFRPLRNQEVTDSQIKQFLAAHKITLDELHAILEEGDRLGWSS